MNKVFDYKFLIILGMSLVVYFLYREVDTLNKRVSDLEKNKDDDDKKEKTKKKLIELPPPPPEENNNINEMVEEYSNEEIDHMNQKIYSHDNLDTNSEQSSEKDTMMIDSILNMVKPDNTVAKNVENKLDISDNSSEQVKQVEQTNQSEHSEHTEQSGQVGQDEQSENNTESLENDLVMDETSNKNNDELKLIKKNKTFSLDALNKKKLEELQEIANNFGININNENGKKKRKADLAQDIFSKQ